MFRKSGFFNRRIQSYGALLLPTQNKERSLLKAACYGIHLPESLHFRNAEILDFGWLFRSISIITVTLNNSQLESLDRNEGVAHFP